MPYDKIVIIDNVPHNDGNSHHAPMLAEVLTDGFDDFRARVAERDLLMPEIRVIEMTADTVDDIIAEYDRYGIEGNNYYLIDACLLCEEENNVEWYSNGMNRLSGHVLAMHIYEHNRNSEISLMSRFISMDTTGNNINEKFLPIINKPIDRENGELITSRRPRSLYKGYLNDEFCVKERLPEFCNIVFCKFFGIGVIE